MHIVSVGTPIFWLGFTLLVVLMLAIDLGVFHRDAHEVKFKEALIWSIVWTSLAAIFCLCSAFWFGKTHALEFATGYIIEWALSVDNIFIFVIIFTYFAVPKNLHHRVLFWGIIGAVVMRAIFIFAGTALLQRFHFVMYFFGALLLFTSFRLFIQKETDIHPDRNPILRLFRKFFPVVSKFHGANFWVKENGRWHATPLFLVLLVVEVTDLIFAVDSIPAIFAITSDPFIVFTSNIFAIMGLRSLYFLISGVMDKFHYLKF
jgi:tellurite resistance protein TerC